MLGVFFGLCVTDLTEHEDRYQINGTYVFSIPFTIMYLSIYIYLAVECKTSKDWSHGTLNPKGSFSIFMVEFSFEGKHNRSSICKPINKANQLTLDLLIIVCTRTFTTNIVHFEISMQLRQEIGGSQ